jgi:hypothetical protein
MSTWYATDKLAYTKAKDTGSDIVSKGIQSQINAIGSLGTKITDHLVQAEKEEELKKIKAAEAEYLRRATLSDEEVAANASSILDNQRAKLRADQDGIWNTISAWANSGDGSAENIQKIKGNRVSEALKEFDPKDRYAGIDTSLIGANIIRQARLDALATPGTPEWLAAQEAKNSYKTPEQINEEKYISKLQAIPTTKKVENTVAMKEYNAQLADLQNKLLVEQKIVDRGLKTGRTDKFYKDAATKVDAYKQQIEKLAKPDMQEKPISRDEYMQKIMALNNELKLQNPASVKNVQNIVEGRLALLYPKTKTTALTPYQQLQVQQKQADKLEEEQTSISRLKDVLGKDKAIEYLQENPKATPKSIMKYAEDESKKKYKNTSITKAISGVVTDADKDNWANIADRSEELNKVLNKHFKGNKENMVQEIEGYYKRQGTGALHNWGSGSPMGDALDNFLSKYKDK